LQRDSSFSNPEFLTVDYSKVRRSSFSWYVPLLWCQSHLEPGKGNDWSEWKIRV